MQLLAADQTRVMQEQMQMQMQMPQDPSKAFKVRKSDLFQKVNNVDTIWVQRYLMWT